MKIPDFDLLSREYPDYWNFPKPEMVRNYIGGETKDRDITNTCTIRLSHAMNASGAPIPRVWDDIVNRRGKNKKYYIIRVKNFRTWMEHTFGKPDHDFQKKTGTAFDRGKIQGREGVIAFEIGFKDATGHVDLWYQDKFSHERDAGKDYFFLAHRISLWSTGTITTVAPA
jgi:hypothetical protein